jgi:thymidine phosphorylase
VTLLPQEVIRAKRDGRVLPADVIEAFVAGITDGRVSEGQIGAFAMAVLLQGMNVDERVALTRAMTASGTSLNWTGLDGPVVDKHSTGGVGDTVSLALAPAVAACGAYVPMISGRGLGHTGGTYDKMEAIPGYVADPDQPLFRRVVREVGCAIIGQTADLAPADKRVYAVRDVTATVESIPLITASILSKKLAAGLDALVMDVKVGNGAFMARHRDAVELANSLATVATGAGLPTVALLTAMDQPLASAAGNAVEVRYIVDYLRGDRREPRFHEVVVALGADMLTLGGLTPTNGAGVEAMTAALDSGAAAERFAAMVRGLGGPSDLVEHPERHLAAAPIVRAVNPRRRGLVTAIDTRAVGLAVVALGGGRTRPQDPVDHAVGLTELAAVGDTVGADRPLAVIHARSDAAADAAADALQAAYRIGGRAAAPLPVVLERIDVTHGGPT